MWRYLGSVDAAGEPSFTISVGASSLGYGSYELAVTSVDATGVESARHSSLDWSADPASGWYVNWYGPPEWYLDWENNDNEHGR